MNTSDKNFLEQEIVNRSKDLIEENNISEEIALKIIKNTIDIAEDYSRPMTKLCSDIQNRYNNFFKHITQKIFIIVLKHLRSIANQRIENRNIGVNIIIFTKKNTINTFGEYEIKPTEIKNPSIISNISGFFKDDNNTLKSIYKCIDSSNIFFAFYYDKNEDILEYNGIHKLSNNQTMNSVCNKNTIGFNLSDGVSCIRIYNDGHRIIDYFRSETNGEWMPRFEKDIIESLKHLNVKLEDLILLTKIVMQLSYLRLGAMLIVTDETDKLHDYGRKPCELIVEELESAENSKIIYTYAAYDGAVIIENLPDSNLNVKDFGVFISPSKKIPSNSPYVYLLKYTNSGTRHEKAVNYAYENKNDTIIVVSENRSISIIHGDEPLYWRDDNNPNEMVKRIKEKRGIKCKY